MLSENIRLEGKSILVTGAAGFIGSSLIKTLLQRETAITIVGVDNLNDYYDVSLKVYRIKQINEQSARKKDVHWNFVIGNLEDRELLDRLFAKYQFSVVINLAAQAGVRYSVSNPDCYIESNIVGFYNVLEACRHNHVEHFIYASSSSVYGNKTKVPYSISDPVDQPMSLYAATKKSNELMAYAYAALYGIPSTGIRFFTVYGPAGRPDMAYYSFTDKLCRGEKIQIFNYGHCMRDFTYIDDAVEGILRIIYCAPEGTNAEGDRYGVPYRIYNIGNSKPETLENFVAILQQELVETGVLAADYDFERNQEFVAMQPGDVAITYADITELKQDFGFTPKTSLKEGLRHFAIWYKAFYQV